MKEILKVVIERARKADEIIIVGAGNRGRELLESLKKESAISVNAFFDNNETITGNSIDGIEIKHPYKVTGGNALYIIAIDSAEIRQQLRAQLQSLGIGMDEIVFYYNRNYNYMCSLDERYYKEELQAMYYECFRKEINWENPVTYNEKINWEKLNVKDERRKRLADKLVVRDWIREQIGEQYLTRLYGVWDDADDIDFADLPEAFALKLNNGSGRNIIVKDKSRIDQEKIREQLNKWKNRKFGYMTLELHYLDIIPKIICEEYLEGMAESVYDYNIYCFHGEPEYIWCIKGSHRPECQASFYTKDWEMMPFSYGYPKDNILAPKPEKLDEMLELSRKLCKDFKHVRVDWYNLPDGRVLFGEMTFATWAGLRRWEPEEYDTVFGNMI